VDFRIRQIQCFLTLSELLNYNKTARALYMTQPTITFQIKSLEESLGVRLFDRDRQSVRLTKEGRAFHHYARTILDTTRAAQACLSNLHSRLNLRVSCGPVGQFILLPSILRALSAKHPDFELEVMEMTTEQMMTGLRDGTVDALLMVAPLPIPQMKYEMICEDTLVAMVSNHSPLAGQRSISVQALRTTPVIASRLRDCRFHQPFLREMLAPYGVTPRIVESPQSCTVQFAYAAAGEGLALAPRAMAASNFPELTARPFQEALPKLQMGLATMGEVDTPALALFRKVVRECAANAFPVTAPSPQRPRPVPSPVVVFPAQLEAS